MAFIKYINRVRNHMIGINKIVLFLSLLSIGHASQMPPKNAQNTIAGFFPDKISKQVSQIYDAIPRSLIIYLDKKEVLKKIKFQSDLSNVDVVLGNEQSKSLNLFENELFKSLRQEFQKQGIIEIQPAALAKDIRIQYETQMKEWAKKGETVSTILTFNKSYDNEFGDQRIKIDAYIHVLLTQRYEKNWVLENKHKITYELSIDIAGASLNSAKAAGFNQLVTQDGVEKAIEAVRAKAPVGWDDEF